MEEKIPCRHGECTAKIKPSNWASHLLKCPHALIPCVFEQSGCKIRVTQVKMPKHIKNCAFAPRITVTTTTPSTKKSASPGSNSLVPCVFKSQGCPANVLAARMEKHKERCPFSGTKAASANQKKVVPKASPNPKMAKKAALNPLSDNALVKKPRLRHRTSRCRLTQGQYCKLFGLSDCLLSFNGVDLSAHASEIHGLPAVWTEGLNDFEVTIDSQKKGQTRDLEWLASVDFKPVAIVVQATKTYALWLKTEIIPEKGITWWITHSDVNDAVAILTAKMTFYNVRDEKMSWTWRGPVIQHNETLNGKCFSIPCYFLFGRAGWRLRIRICEGTINMKKVVNVCNVWKDPNDVDAGTSLGSSSGINLKGQAGSSRAAVEILKQSSEDEEVWLKFVPQQRREFYLAIQKTLDSMNKLGIDGGGPNDEENEEESDVAHGRAAGLLDRHCIQCDELITGLTADFCDACLENNE